MTKWNRWLFSIVATIFASIGIYTSIDHARVETSPVTQAAAQLIASSMPDSDGRQHDLAQWKGKSLLVNFWATWCAPCVEEMPELSAMQSAADKKNIQIIGIGIDSAAKIGEFSKKHNIRYPLYVADASGLDLSRQFGNQAGGLPFTVFISPDGQVKKSYLGRLDFNELKSDLELP